MLNKIIGFPNNWRVMNATSRDVWKCYFALRFVLTFYSYLIVSKLTQLGDTERYLDKATQLALYDEGIGAINSTILIDTLGGASSAIFGKLLGNLPFNFLATYGIYYSVSKLYPRVNVLISILFLLSLHSFSTWTTVASKEALCVFGMGLCMGYLIDFDKQGRWLPNILEWLGIAVTLIIKPQYLAAIMHVWFFMFLARHTKSKWLILGVSALVLAVDIGFIWYFRRELNELSLLLYINFEDGASSRLDFWVHENDIFRKALYGVYIAFWGPSFSQVLEGKWTVAFAYLESLVIALILFGRLTYITLNSRFRFSHCYPIIVLFFGWAWLLLVHYPSGALNAGSALRYRENFFAFFVVLLYWCYLKIKATFAAPTIAQTPLITTKNQAFS